MKSEALDAFATQSMRSTALEAAAADQGQAKSNAADTKNKPTDEDKVSPKQSSRPAFNRLNTPFGQRNDGTESTAKAFEGVVEGLKAAMHEAVVWTEKKADALSHSEDHAEPYDSPATAAAGISDLDVIASGILPATVPVQEDWKDKGSEDAGQRRENENPRS